MRIAQTHQRPEVINSLHHGLTFATDAEVNRRILTKYRLHTFLTPRDEDNAAILQSVIDDWSDYANKLYETTLYDYNPIENFNRTEKGWDVNSHDITNDHSSGTVDSTLDQSLVSELHESGYDTTDAGDDTILTSKSKTYTEPDKNKTHQDNTSDRTMSEKGDSSYEHHLYGNIGVMSTQQMIQMERDIIIDVLDWYVNKFAEAFNLDMEVSFYGCL